MLLSVKGVTFNFTVIAHTTPRIFGISLQVSIVVDPTSCT